MKAEEQSTATKKATENTFAVIVHGMSGVAIDDNNHRLKLYVPEVMGHVYGIGPFRHEMMMHGNYRLEVPDISEKSCYIDKDTNAKIKNKAPVAARNVIDLPFPNFPTNPIRLRIVRKGLGKPFFNGLDTTLVQDRLNRRG
jgi:hypothetical protein